MLPLPWWILGVGPQDESDDEPEQETVDGPASHEPLEEVCPATPVSVFRTPSASPFIDVPDQLPKVVEFQTFLNVAKRRSSSRMESVTPKLRKTAKRDSLVRSETEIMNKSADGQSILDFDETFGVTFNTEPAQTESPMPFKDIFNQTFQFLDHDSTTQNEEESTEESPSAREFPLFFTSFDDTTVLFNTTIAGDIDLTQKNDAVGDWIFKNNEFLQDQDTKPVEPESGGGTGEIGEAVFKEPVQQKRRGRPRAGFVRPEHTTSSRRAASPDAKPAEKKKKRIEEDVHEEIESEKKETVSTPRTTPSLSRRHTPSRKAKTYKSLKE